MARHGKKGIAPSAQFFVEKNNNNAASIIWFFHPQNKLEEGEYHSDSGQLRKVVVPFFSKEATASFSFPGAQTASRSTVVFLPDSAGLISLKLPTNFPQLPQVNSADKGVHDIKRDLG